MKQSVTLYTLQFDLHAPELNLNGNYNILLNTKQVNLLLKAA